MKSWEIAGPRRFQAAGLRVPSDKSITHRALILGALARGATEIRSPLNASDCRATANAVCSLGATIKKGAKAWTINGVGLTGLKEPDNVIDVGNSGTSMRLLAGLLAAQPFFSVLTGDSSLRRRPMRRIVEPLRQIGAEIDGRDDGDHAPLVVRGGPLQAASHELPIASAQVKSCILLAGLFIDGDTSVREPSPSRDHTERMLAAFGLPITYEPGFVKIRGGQTYESLATLEVPADVSSAAYFLAGATVCEESKIRLLDVGTNATRLGFVNALNRMGGHIQIEDEVELTGEPRAGLTAETRELAGAEIEADELPALIDEVPILAVAATKASTPTTVNGAGELRVKESDRLQATQDMLRAFGAETTIGKNDTLTIQPAAALHGAEINCGGDHRIAMAAAVAACLAEGTTTIHDVGCVDTSYPKFMEDFLEHTEHVA